MSNMVVKILNELYYSVSIKTVNLLPLTLRVKYVNILTHTYCNLSSYNSINGHCNCYTLCP